MNSQYPAIRTISLNKQLSFDLLLVEGGRFIMGDNKSEYDYEKPEHPVEIPSFYMGKYPVTQDIWQAVMRKNPSRFKGDRRPVENVSWDDTQIFIEKLNKKTKQAFRLPTEAEWEYAARGGRLSEGYTYAGSDKLKQVGWYDENSNGETHEVGQLMANELGLHDMSGNVWEWCEDNWHGNYEGAPKDGTAWVDAPERGAGRVIRGGSYFNVAVSCRAAGRIWLTPGYRDGADGFRLVGSFQSVG